MEITTENVTRVFGSVELNEGTRASIKLITDKFTQMAMDVLTTVPRCPTRTVVLRKLLEGKMLAVDSIAKGGTY